MNQKQTMVRDNQWGINLAIAAAFLNLLCDLLLYAGPADGGIIYDMPRLLPALAGSGEMRILLGTGLGIVLISVWFLALPVLSDLLTTARRHTRMLVLSSYAMFVGSCIAFHTSFGFMALLGDLINSGALNSTVAIEAFTRFSPFIMLPMFATLLMFSLSFALIAFFGKTVLPKWTLLVTPLSLCMLLPALASMIPAPIGAAVAMLASTFGVMVFLIFLRIVAFNH